LIFQQLGQLVRWSWGYHVLLARAEKYEEEGNPEDIEGGYSESAPLIAGLDGETDDEDDYPVINGHGTSTTNSFESGGRTPITSAKYAGSVGSDEEDARKVPGLLSTPTNGNAFPRDDSNGNITSFPSIRTPTPGDEGEIPSGIKGIVPMVRIKTKRGVRNMGKKIEQLAAKGFHALPPTTQTVLSTTHSYTTRFFAGAYEFMNPPLWAMLIAIIIASIPRLQRLFFEEGTFINNSVTRAVSQSGGVAVPLILVVLGANLARNTLPKEAHDEDSEENQIGTKLLIASLISRMLLPTLIMAPLLALAAKFIPVSILDDPIFVIVCFLLTGAPSALQLAQICQINGVYEGVMSKLLFQSYVIWILPSTLVLVMCALEVVQWAA
jgi:predicted permease